MDTLWNKFKNTDDSGHSISRMNPEEIADTLFCLCNAVEEGTLNRAAPENITIKEDGTVSVSQEAGLNIYYAAPEIVLGKKNADKNSGWFTLGLLAYFVINGRSYYEDKSFHIVNLQDMMANGSSLIIAQGVNEEVEDVPSLLRLSIQKFTSWAPESRAEGVPILLRAVEQYSAKAKISYRYLEQTIATKTIMVGPPSANFTTGSVVSGDDGKVYFVSENVSIPFRPGKHPYIVKVDVSHSDQYERYLCVQPASRSKKTKLMKLDTDVQMRKIEVDRRIDQSYLFYVLTGDSVRQKTIHEEYKFHVDIPAAVSVDSSLLQITYNPANGYEVVLYNRAGTEQISANVLYFEL